MSELSEEPAEPVAEVKEDTSTEKNAHLAVAAPKTAETAASRLAAIIPEDILPLFTDPPLLSTEDLDAYLRWLGYLVDGIKPRDPFEWMFINGMADLYWEARRLRKLKAGIIELTRFKPPDNPTNQESNDLENSPVAKFEKESALTLALIRESNAVYDATMDKCLKALDKSYDAPKKTAYVRLQEEMETAEAFLRSINFYAGADRLLESVESRLNELYRQLRIHRESFSRARPSTNDVIDAEYSESSASKP